MPKLPKLPKPLERNLEAIDKVPLLERRREIVAGRRIYNRRKKAEGAPTGNNNAGKQRGQNDPVVSTADKTRDAIAAEIAKAAYHIHRHHGLVIRHSRRGNARAKPATRPG